MLVVKVDYVIIHITLNKGIINRVYSNNHNNALLKGRNVMVSDILPKQITKASIHVATKKKKDPKYKLFMHPCNSFSTKTLEKVKFEQVHFYKSWCTFALPNLPKLWYWYVWYVFWRIFSSTTIAQSFWFKLRRYFTTCTLKSKE